MQPCAHVWSGALPSHGQLCRFIRFARAALRRASHVRHCAALRIERLALERSRVRCLHALRYCALVWSFGLDSTTAGPLRLSHRSCASVVAELRCRPLRAAAAARLGRDASRPRLAAAHRTRDRRTEARHCRGPPVGRTVVTHCTVAHTVDCPSFSRALGAATVMRLMRAALGHEEYRDDVRSSRYVVAGRDEHRRGERCDTVPRSIPQCVTAPSST